MISGSRRFGEYIHALRESRRLTLEDVERITAGEPEPVTRSLLSRLENGKARFSALKLLALARAYRVRIGVMAERLEIACETGRLELERAQDCALPELLARAREAGLAGEVFRALALYEAAEVRAMDAHDRRARAAAQLGIVRALTAAGRWASARIVIDDLLTGDIEDDQRVWALYLFVTVAIGQGQRLIAHAALLALSEVPRPWPLEIDAHAPALRAQLLLAAGQLDAAFDANLDALDRAQKLGARQRVAGAAIRMAQIERLRGRLAEAQEWLARATADAETLGLGPLVVRAWVEEGRIHRARRRADAARSALARARRLARRLDDEVELFAVYAEIWRMAEADGQAAEARAALRTLRHLARKLESLPAEAGDVRRALARTAAVSAPPAALEAL